MNEPCPEQHVWGRTDDGDDYCIWCVVPRSDKTLAPVATILCRERDEARAEVERLRTELTRITTHWRQQFQGAEVADVALRAVACVIEDTLAEDGLR